MAETYLLAMRCPVCRRRESHSGFRMERENLAGDAKGKGASGSHREAESTDAPERGGLPRSSNEAGVMLVERRGWVTEVGSGQPATGGTRSINGRRQPSNGGTSRMTRECQVRICERLGVKFPGPTRRWRSGLTVSVVIGKLLSGVRLQTPRSSRQGAPPATAVLFPRSPRSRLSPREAGYREAISCSGPNRQFAAAQRDAGNGGKSGPTAVVADPSPLAHC